MTNIGRDELVWVDDGCANPVRVDGTIDGAAWRTGVAPDRQPTREAGIFKSQVVDRWALDGPIVVRLVPERLVGRGHWDCDLIGDPERVKPGRNLRRRLVWEGQAFPLLGPPLAGPVELMATFESYWRVEEGEPEDGAFKTLDLRIDSWIADGADPTWLHPLEVVDAALANDRFRRFIEANDLEGSHDPVLRFDAMRDRWEVGLHLFRTRDDGTDQTSETYVTVDHRTGAVGELVTVPWLDAEASS